MTKEEIRSLLDENYNTNKNWLIDYIFFLESDRTKYENAIKLAQELINNSVSKDRYNDIVNKYNRLVKKTKQGKFVDIK